MDMKSEIFVESVAQNLSKLSVRPTPVLVAPHTHTIPGFQAVPQHTWW